MLENTIDATEIKSSDELLKAIEGLIFEKDNKLKNLRYFVKPGEKPKSVSGIYLCALLIENEYQDLYGLTFEGLAIDYKGHLYLTPNSPKAPLA